MVIVLLRCEEAMGGKRPVGRIMSTTRKIRHKRGSLHVETPLGVVSIRAGLADLSGRAVDSVQVLPDDNAVRDGLANTRLIGTAKRPADDVV